jgi:DNA primase
LDKAKSSIRSRDYSVVVEGQMDLILSHQAGFTNTVAVSGTAFTDSTIDSQLRHGSSEASESKINNLGLVRRLSPNIIFAYDGDEAGIRATSRSAMIALSLDMQVKVAILPGEKDPADIILEDSNKWKDIIKNSVNIISFHLDRICRAGTDIRSRGKKIREIIFPFLMMINSSIEKSAYINEIHFKTGISETAIMEDYKNYEKTQKPDENLIKDKTSDIKDVGSRRDSLEKKLFGIIFWCGENEEQSKIINDLKSSFEEDIGSEEFKKMLDLYEPFSETLAFEAEMWYSDKIDALIEDAKEIILNLEEEVFREEASLLMARINQKEQNKDKENFESDLKNYQKIVEKIEDIKSRRSK